MSQMDSERIDRDCLIGVVNNDIDLRRYADERWYRIPARAVGRSLKREAIEGSGVLALYQGAGIRDGLPSAIELWGEIEGIDVRPRRSIIPDEPRHPAADDDYYLIRVGTVERLDSPILSRRPRRITFLRTTRGRLFGASEISDLIVGTAAEERLWRSLREEGMAPERKLYMRVGEVVTEVDFALFRGDRALGIVCREGEAAEPAGGDAWEGWRIIRFSPAELEGRFAACLREITELASAMRGGGELD
ncbi:MAG: hypothetical protein ABIR47_03700 [Candidatus Kapaibacterium sp.]